MSREENYVQDAGDRELLQPYCNLYWIEFTDSKKKKKNDVGGVCPRAGSGCRILYANGSFLKDWDAAGPDGMIDGKMKEGGKLQQ